MIRVEITSTPITKAMPMARRLAMGCQSPPRVAWVKTITTPIKKAKTIKMRKILKIVVIVSGAIVVPPCCSPHH
jgi:hypothetical protein